MEKVCVTCKQTLSPDRFRQSKSLRGGLRPSCRDCELAYSREHYRNNKEGHNLRHYKNTLNRKFGMDRVKYSQKWEEQGGVCAICAKPNSDFARRFAVDHNHLTGEVRGLLCINCNTALGNMQDSPELLRKAATYLEHNGKLNYGND